jgi:glycosyltransferase involved in cell wall biosynthesis
LEDTVRVSAALIVKNEKHTLGHCLHSIRAYVDEIVIVDTGSTDGTRNVARQYTDRIYEFPWHNDFAAARQFSFNQATGDWVFWLDADDVVINADQIRPHIQAASADIKGFYWKYLIGQDEYGNSTGELWRERCIRNGNLFRWVGRVHEVLVPSAPTLMGWNHEIVVVHRPDRSRRNNDRPRNINILNEEYEHTRANPAPRLLLYLGNEYADLEKPELAIDFLRRYVRASTWDDEKYLAQIRIAELLRYQRKFEEALQAARQASKICPHWPQAYFSLAETFYFLQDWPAVIHWIETGRRLPMPHTPCIVNPMDYRYRWMIHYTNALFYTGHVQEALEWTLKALEICPTDKWHLTNCDVFASAIAPADPLPDDSSTAISRRDRLPTVVWHAPLFDASGYAEEARQFILGLDAVGIRTRAMPFIQWTNEQVSLPSPDKDRLGRLVTTTLTPADQPLVSVMHLQGHNFQRIPHALYHIGRTMCETDRIPPSWVPTCNQMDEVWVPCQFNVESFARSGVVREKLVKIPEGIDIERFQLDAPPLPIRGRRRFNFLSVFQWSRRKGWDVLVRAFVREFWPEDNIALIIKIGYHSGHRLEQLRQQILAELRAAGVARVWPPHLVLHQANLTADELPRLYRTGDAFVLPTRGEGWGRPFMEAMLMGLPCIGTRYSGHLEFMNDDNAYLIDCNEVDVAEPAWQEADIFRGHRWAEPSEIHLRQLMRQVFEDRQTAYWKGQAARDHIATNFRREQVALLVKARLNQIAEQLLKA